MATYTKELLSGSTGGRPIKVTGTASNTAVTIHTTGVSNTVVDEVWLYANNRDSIQRTIYIEFGGTSTPDDIISVAVEPNAGLYIASPGLPLQGDGTNGRTINAYASASNVVGVTGYVNRITP
jgi:hypothetical protein